jgi:hypothetical protein
MGPDTISFVNLADGQFLLAEFRLAMIRFYVDLCNRRQADRNELLGWLNRALA